MRRPQMGTKDQAASSPANPMDGYRLGYPRVSCPGGGLPETSEFEMINEVRGSAGTRLGAAWAEAMGSAKGNRFDTINPLKA
jgi:hypothetical protein